jgi:NAD(P)-dependent dehydrogenase (short-subunit alcohol dehydrogenase family)
MKKIIVTGSSSGFGLQTVQTLAAKGHTVYATMRNVKTKNADTAKQLLDWAKENKADVRVLELDVTSDQSVQEAISQIAAETGGQIDVLINNAGNLVDGFIETLSTSQLEWLFQVHVFGVDRMNKAVLPYMHKRNSGLLLVVTSGLSRLHLPYLGSYSAAKAAADTLAETLQYELQDTGIDSVIVQPGAYPTTDLFKNRVEADNPGAEKAYGEFAAKVKRGITNLFAPTPQNSDSTEVARLIAEIVDTPAKQRKTWFPIGLGEGQPVVESINESIGGLSQHLQSALGMKN